MRDWNEISIDQAAIDRFVEAFNCGLIRLEIKIVDDNDATDFSTPFAKISSRRIEIEAQKRVTHSNMPRLIIDRGLA